MTFSVGYFLRTHNPKLVANDVGPNQTHPRHRDLLKGHDSKILLTAQKSLINSVYMVKRLKIKMSLPIWKSIHQATRQGIVNTKTIIVHLLNHLSTSLRQNRPLLGTLKIHLRVKHCREASWIHCANPMSDKENNEQLLTPLTPRHRGAPLKRVQLTPCHRRVMGMPLTPRTPQTPRTIKRRPTVYDCARQTLRTNEDSPTLIGRDKERDELKGLLRSYEHGKGGRSVYISGPPGTGKSALVREVCNDVSDRAGVKSVYINCMSVSSSRDLRFQLLKELSEHKFESIAPSSSKDPESELCSILSSQSSMAHRTYLIILDEIDHLLKFDCQILSQLFEWCSWKDSPLVLLAIANSLDLTDRYLPRVKGSESQPHLLPFMPYSAAQIGAVITSKLRSLIPTGHDQVGDDFIPLFSSSAIQLCGKKVAACAGDLRKAFDIVRRTIDAIECETKAKDTVEQQESPSRRPLSDNINLKSHNADKPAAMTSPGASLTPLTAPRATVAHVSRVAAAILANGTKRRLQGLNVHQKAALMALISHRKPSLARHSANDSKISKPLGVSPTVKRLYQTHRDLCFRDSQLRSLTFSEFSDILSGLLACGLISNDTTGSPKKKVVSSKRAKEERRLLPLVSWQELKGCLTGSEEAILGSLWHED